MKGKEVVKVTSVCEMCEQEKDFLNGDNICFRCWKVVQGNLKRFPQYMTSFFEEDMIERAEEVLCFL